MCEEPTLSPASLLYGSLDSCENVVLLVYEDAALYHHALRF